MDTIIQMNFMKFNILIVSLILRFRVTIIFIINYYKHLDFYLDEI